MSKVQVACDCGKSYPHYTEQGLSKFCPHCGRPSKSSSLGKYYSMLIASRSAHRSARRQMRMCKVLMR